MISVTFVVLFAFAKIFVICQPRYSFISFDPLAGGWGANTEPWQLYADRRQELLCVKRLNVAPIAPASTNDPVLSLVNVANPFGVAIVIGGPNDPCQKPGFYMWMAECNAAIGDDCGAAGVPLPGGAAATAAGLAGFVSAAGGTRFIVTYVGRTEQALGARLDQHCGDLNPPGAAVAANADFAKRRTWRAWYEVRRTFVVGFPVPQGVSPGIEMMFLRPSLLNGGHGLRFPLNDGDSTWGNRVPPNSYSRISYYFPVEQNTVRSALMVAGCAFDVATKDAARLVSSKVAAVAALGVFATVGGGGGPVVPIVAAYACGLTGAVVAGLVGAAALPGLPAPMFAAITLPKRKMWFPPGLVVGAFNILPASYAFDAAGGGGPHVYSMLAQQMGAKVQAAITSLSGTHQLLGAALP